MIENNKYYPLSSGQSGLWYSHQLEPFNFRFNVPVTFTISDNVSNNDFLKIIKELVNRHSLLRSGFHLIDGKPMRRVSQSIEIDFNVFEQTYDELSDGLLVIKSIAEQNFDLEKKSLFKVSIFNNMAGRKLVLMVFHHLVFDGASLPLLLSELEKINSTMLASDLELDTIDSDYHDYVVWQQKWLQSEQALQSKAYWRSEISGELPRLNLSTSIDKSSSNSNGQIHKFSIDKNVIEKIFNIAKSEKCSEYYVWKMAYVVFLSRYYDNANLLINTPYMARPESSFDEIIGCFANVVPLLFDIDSSKGFAEILSEYKNKVYESFYNADLPIEDLIDTLELNNKDAFEAIFQTGFVWTLTEQLKPSSNSTLDINIIPLVHQAGEQDLALELLHSEDSIDGIFKYKANVFSATEISQLTNCYLTFISKLCEFVKQPVANLDVLSASQQSYLLNELNDTRVEYPSNLAVHQLFEEQVAKFPNSLALVGAGACPDKHGMTYQELNQKSNQLAHYLLESEILTRALTSNDNLAAGEVIVGICFERSLEMVIAMLAISKLGAAYLPLDPKYPTARLEYMAKDSELSLLLTQKRLSNIIEKQSIAKLMLDDDTLKEKLKTYPNTNLKLNPAANQLAYIIYTSGSTGRPKGVLNEQAALLNLCQWYQETYQINQHSCATHLCSIGFDAAVLDVWPYLISGGRVELISDETRVSPSQLIERLQKSKVTHCILPTALLLTCLDDINAAEGFSLTYLFTGGDKLPAITLSHSNIQLINLYGPTEAAVVSSSFNLLNEFTGIPPIGRPISNSEAYILSNEQQLLPFGVVGELYIGGKGVARGYLNNPELSTERFIKNPFSDDTRARLYRTGDLVRYQDNGSLEFIGRTDRQVQIRGFRVELGEIEHQLLNCSGINSAVVIAHQNINAHKRLQAYLVIEGKADDFELDELKLKLKSILPDYMQPAGYTFLGSIPLTNNGKLDRKALPVPEVDEGGYEAPNGEVETVLAVTWSNLLGMPAEKISRYSNFFELGGHSLLVVKLISELKIHLNVDIDFKRLFELPTLRDMAEPIASLLKRKKLAERLDASEDEIVDELEW